jgi:threonine dehydrogenase-like Zn-dependent dehydrogenase
MLALWLQDGVLDVREVAAPTPKDEALVRVTLSGICGTDLELTRGYYPFTGVIGHEFVGEVVASPDSEWLGKRVVGEINANCRACTACSGGRPSHCEHRTVLGIVGRNGSHAEHVAVPVANLHLVPDGVSDDAAVFTEPLAAAVEVLQQVHIRPTDRVLLVGAGRLGQLIARVIALTGAHLRVIAKHAHQRELLEVANIQATSEAEVGERCWDVVIEATGSPGGFELARLALRPRGVLVLKSTYAGDMTLNLSPFVVDEITIIGSRCGPFEPALGLLAQGLVDPTPLISARFDLKQGVEAMQKAQESDIMKVVLKP